MHLLVSPGGQVVDLGRSVKSVRVFVAGSLDGSHQTSRRLFQGYGRGARAMHQRADPDAPAEEWLRPGGNATPAVGRGTTAQGPGCASPRSRAHASVHGQRRRADSLEALADAALEEILTALTDGAPSRLFPCSEAGWGHRLPTRLVTGGAPPVTKRVGHSHPGTRRRRRPLPLADAGARHRAPLRPRLRPHGPRGCVLHLLRARTRVRPHAGGHPPRLHQAGRVSCPHLIARQV